MSNQPIELLETSELPTEFADLLRRNLDQDADHKSALGQYLTPVQIARFLASLFESIDGEVRLLDPGAGVGALTAAFVEEACGRKKRPMSIHASVYELDSALEGSLSKTMAKCGKLCQSHGIQFSSTIIIGDFIELTTSQLSNCLFESSTPSFTHVIMNPPYKKIRSDSSTRKQLRKAGIETSNLYTAFMSLAQHLIEESGQFVSITPRSFCNGPYFKSFRHSFLDAMRLKRAHLFESRKDAFKEDAVLQENVVLAADRGVHAQRDRVLITSSYRSCDEETTSRIAPYNDVISPSDADRFIHLATDDAGAIVSQRVGRLVSNLVDAGVSVSTGRVVDFRAKEHLRREPDDETLPLLYPCNISQSGINWPRSDTKKPQSLADCEETRKLLVPSGYYVLVKRFTTKEEAKRIVACVFDPNVINADRVGFENHLNYFHCDGSPMPKVLAVGLATFLNSTAVDMFFRQFNGHTQVNATDLRNMRYPSQEQLKSIGKRMIFRKYFDVKIADEVVGEVLGWN